MTVYNDVYKTYTTHNWVKSRRWQSGSCLEKVQNPLHLSSTGSTGFTLIPQFLPSLVLDQNPSLHLHSYPLVCFKLWYYLTKKVLIISKKNWTVVFSQINELDGFVYENLIQILKICFSRLTYFIFRT